MKRLKNQKLRDGLQERNLENIRETGIKKAGVKHYAPNFGHKILICFMPLILITLTLGAGLIYEVGSGHLFAKIQESAIRHPSEQDKVDLGINQIRGILKGLQNHVILVVSVLLLSVIIMMFFFMGSIAKPLDELGKVAFQMVNGRLNELVPVRTNDEIGKIGELINDLAINLQEILLHVWNHTGQDIVLLDRIGRIVNSQPGGNGMPPEIREDFRFVRQDIEDMQTMVKAFDFYRVRLDQTKVMKNDQPREKKHSG
jgi:HAMP domain-containing protein